MLTATRTVETHLTLTINEREGMSAHEVAQSYIAIVRVLGMLHRWGIRTEYAHTSRRLSLRLVVAATEEVVSGDLLPLLRAAHGGRIMGWSIPRER